MSESEISVNKNKMLKEMRGLWKRDSLLFDEIVKDYISRGADVFPSDKRRRIKRQSSVVDWVWAHVEFLRWRDSLNQRDAYARVAKGGMDFMLYDTSDGAWAPVVDQPQPSKFNHQVSTVATIKGHHHNKQDRTDVAEIILGQFKDAHEGKPSIFTKDDLNRYFPASKK